MRILNPDFIVGNTFEHAGCRYRIRPGKNGPGDKVIEISLDGGGHWWIPPIAHGLIMFEFKCEVEENNYPPPAMGNRKLKLAYAATEPRGWRAVQVEIAGERR